MAHNILVVDGNVAFATMLMEMLETEGGYRVRVAPGGNDALAILERVGIDLTIVDMDLESDDMSYLELIRRIRRVRPAMRLVLIPVMGQAVPPEAHELQIQGILSKPFFADDLLPSIKQAMAAAPPPEPRTHPARRAAGAKPDQRVQELLRDLARETNADLVALLALEDSGRVVAHVGKPGDTVAELLGKLGFAALQAGQDLAHILGQPDRAFEHNMFESQSFRLYILCLPGNLGLLLAAPLDHPLGAIRHNMRRAGRELAKMPLT